MNFNLLIENLTNPALLFFVLGVVAVYLKSDLEIKDGIHQILCSWTFRLLNGTAPLKIVNNFWNVKNSFYLETSGG